MNPFRSAEQIVRPSRLITIEEFSELYSAVEFAVAFGLPPSGHVTLHWGLLGCTSVEEIQEAFLKFRKCVQGWLRERRIPIVYLWAHENSPRAGLHTHFAVHIPLEMRRAFRRYVREWATRRYKRPPKRGIRTTGMGADSISVWRVFSYLVKGYDQSAVLVSARNHHSGRALRLGDMIANPWQDPGTIDLRERVGVFSSVAKAQRELGYPAGCEVHVHIAAPPPTSEQLFGSPAEAKVGHRHTWTKAQGSTAAFHSRVLPSAQPFRSSFEDGCYDVRRLYPPEFYNWVTQLDANERRPTKEERRLQNELTRMNTANLLSDPDQ